MDANQRIHNDTDQLADMYANLESRIFTEIIQVLQKGKQQDVTAENVIEWQAQQLARSGLLVKKVIQIMAEYDQLDPAYIEQVLQQDGYQIVDETTAELEKLGKKVPEISSNAKNLLDSLVNQTRQTLENTVNQTLLTRNINRNAVVRTYQSILKKSTIETVTGLKTHDKAIKDAIYKQIDEGIPVLKDKAGRTWSLEAYTRMVLTTTANRAYNDARTKRMQEMGQSLCVMTSHPNSRPACAYIQGKVVNIVPDDSPNFNPKYDTIYNHGYGTPAGTLGINCRHVLFPFEDGVNVNHQPQYDPKEAIENGNLQQRQRAYERSIREAKKRLKAAEAMGDVEMVIKTKSLIAGRQRQLREFIQQVNADSGKEYKILVRDYSREQAHNFTRKHVAYINDYRRKEFNELIREYGPHGFPKTAQEYQRLLYNKDTGQAMHAYVKARKERSIEPVVDYKYYISTVNEFRRLTKDMKTRQGTKLNGLSDHSIGRVPGARRDYSHLDKEGNPTLRIGVSVKNVVNVIKNGELTEDNSKAEGYSLDGWKVVISKQKKTYGKVVTIKPQKQKKKKRKKRD